MPGYADNLFDLTDRVVLITGGSRGLGREGLDPAGRPRYPLACSRAERNQLARKLFSEICASSL
ncbi:MAG TPA: hypothetical protein VLU24_05875, partial [Mycobacterium sp.]|nr:hypothetical protein [Mycobacterium sp.]